MAVLLDTSVLCRLAVKSDVDHVSTAAMVMELHRRGDRVCITPQNFVELRNVATRPVSVNGFGMSPAEAEVVAESFERAFEMLPETPAIFPAWKQIVSQAGVIGKQVHDARLVAVCQAHGVDQLLTFNVNHFSRLVAVVPRLTILDPHSFQPPGSARAT
jgi:predicted nucleic acid-binding protein